MSQATSSARRPSDAMRSATASSRSRRRAASTTFMPARAHSIAVAAPIPEDPPVITITLFARSFMGRRG